MLETVFPDSARLLMSNGRLHSQGRLIGQALAGDLFRSPGGWGARLLGGSRAQGLTLEAGWGQHGALEDTMFFYGAGWGVKVEQPHQPGEMKIEKKDLNDNTSRRSNIAQKLQSKVPINGMYVDINGEETVFYLNRQESRDGINSFIERTNRDQRISDLSISNNNTEVHSDASPKDNEKTSVLENDSNEKASCTDQIVERGLFLHVADNDASFCEVHARGNMDGLVSSMARARIGALGIHHLGEKKARSCLSSQEGVSNLSSYRTRRMLHGEAIETAAHGPDLSMDWVPSLVCSHPLPSIKDFLSRRRNANWPQHSTLQQLGNLPGVLTCLGKCGSERSHFEFRYSWGMHEILLAADMPAWIKQAYCAFKFTVQNWIYNNTDDNERERNDVGIFESYFLKNILWWELEDTDIWEEACAYRAMLLLMNRLSTCLQPTNEGHCVLPHYFLSSCNLLETVNSREIERCRVAVREILTDPLAAVVAAPVLPDEVFGRGNTVARLVEWVGKTLSLRTGREGVKFLNSVKALNSAKGSPTYDTRMRNFQEVLERLDRCREVKDSGQRERDSQHSKVPGRAPLRNLVQMLKGLAQ